MTTGESTATLGTPRSWFLLSTPVGQLPYAAVGFGLALVKYTIEAIAVYALTNQFFSPLDFVNPWLSSKAPFLVDAPAAGLLWLLFTIPFVWIAIAMSVRRAADIGISPWVGLLMLIPLVNLVVMALLAVLPSGMLRPSPQQLAEQDRRRRELAAAFGPPSTTQSVSEEARHLASGPSTMGAVLASLVVGCVTQVAVGAISVWVMELYGFILFFAAPVIAGACTGFVYNQGARQSIVATIGLVIAMNFISFGVMLAIGLDGAICLLMAYPLLGVLSVLGGLVGSAIATAGLRPGMNERRGMIGTILFLPMCLMLESLDGPSPLHRVTTAVEIDAPPQVVWHQVIAFPDIEEEMAWYFRLGIAAPLRARIDGSGVGATRHCEFTTGTFVEPITDWDPPHRLAFDVASQPSPMKEWTPFAGLHPPHLDTGFVSERGEFRIEPLPDGKTRLHGTTWYRIGVRPRLYWKCWADPMVHAIHHRVLDHIARQSQDDPSDR